MDKIGDLLYTERRKKGLEIADVEHATGIRGLYLNALEQSRYEVLPGEVYVKGFLRNYANYLGLDGSHLVQLYTEQKTPPIELTAVSQPLTEPAEPVPNKVNAVITRSVDKKKWSTVLVIVILAISAMGLYLWQKSVAPAGETSRNAAGSKPAGVSGSNQTPVRNVSSATNSGVPSASRPVVLMARFTDRCWTSVIADGKTLYEGIPGNGANFTWEAERQIVVNFGNAAAVELTFNGQPVGKIGDRGDVVVKTFTVAGMISAPVAPAPAAPSPAESTDKPGFNPAPTPTTPPSTSSPTALPRGPVSPGTSGSRP